MLNHIDEILSALSNLTLVILITAIILKGYYLVSPKEVDEGAAAQLAHADMISGALLMGFGVIAATLYKVL